MPSRLGWDPPALAAMATFAQSLAARSAIANPMPQLAPVLNTIATLTLMIKSTPATPTPFDGCGAPCQRNGVWAFASRPQTTVSPRRAAGRCEPRGHFVTENLQCIGGADDDLEIHDLAGHIELDHVNANQVTVTDSRGKLQDASR